MNVLVIGGTGKVGVPLVTHLLQRGVRVCVLLHSAARAQLVPAPATMAIADLIGKPEEALAAFKNTDAVFMLNKASLNETAEGLLAVQLAKSAGVRRFIYQTVHLLEEFAYLPHVAPKLAIKDAIERSGMDYTFLAPNHFYQNDETIRKPLVENGQYLTPLGSIGCWSVDARDVADAAAIVLTSSGHEGQSYSLVGPDKLTGNEAAAAWAKALGRKVQYVKPIETWEEYTRPFMPAWLHYDLSLMYRDFAKRGMLGTSDDVGRLAKLLGRPPRRFEDYARQQAKAWKAQA